MFEKVHKLLLVIFIAIFIIIDMVAWLSEGTSLVAIENLYISAVTFYQFASYFKCEVALLKSMYRLHRFEFNNHIKRMTILFIFTTTSYFLLCLNSIYSSYVGFCITDAGKPEGSVWFDIDNPVGICNFVISSSFNEFTSYVLLIIDFFTILPIIVFMVINKPHDCYECMGKDPDRTYSIY